MAETAYKTLRALSRLGVKGGREVRELIEALQPTVAMGDASALLPPLLPPLVWFGAQNPAPGAGRHMALQVRSVAPGGTLIPQLQLSRNGAGTISFVWRIGDVAGAHAGLTAFTAAQRQEFGPEPADVVVEQGDIATAARVTGLFFPQFRTDDPGMQIVDAFYVPPGQVLTIECGAANVGVVWSGVLQDVPVGLQPDT